MDQGSNKSLTCKNKQMQGKCPVCKNWLEANVYQNVRNGHRFHKDCLSKIKSSGTRCGLCIKDNIPPEGDCHKLMDNNVFKDKAAMRDLRNTKVSCDRCGCVGTYAEVKKIHDEMGCDYAGCSCAIN